MNGKDSCLIPECHVNAIQDDITVTPGAVFVKFSLYFVSLFLFISLILFQGFQRYKNILYRQNSYERFTSSHSLYRYSRLLLSWLPVLGAVFKGYIGISGILFNSIPVYLNTGRNPNCILIGLKFYMQSSRVYVVLKNVKQGPVG